jgi:hypothetical protein
MGPISGLRIVNLRVRDKVAYPDLTLDLAGERADHLVIGLENGGGKSTLLGAVYHVFVPEADQFLPRRAQRRQHKEGELKRLEQYIPGGDPTHFVVEVEAPAPNGVLPMFSAPRLLVGACLWKPAGSPSSAPASEFFWSALSVAPELSLRELGMRGPGGRLLEFREFKAKLKQMRADLPAAQITVEEGKGAWEVHLRNLGIDVEYVRQFLLRMNEDEGAADQVFTYASSRAFLNSLVGVVGDSAAIEQLKEHLADMSRDADAMSLDRQRVVLFEKLVAQTGPLVEIIGELSQRIGERDRTVDRLVAVRSELTRHLDIVRAAAALSVQRTAELERIAAETRNAYSEANARYVLGRAQVARLRLRDASSEVDETERQRKDARAEEELLRVAALLADRRASERRIQEVEELLKQKAVHAEPLRRALSSALQALNRRLTDDIQRREVQRGEYETAATSAYDALTHAADDRAGAATVLGELGGERKGLVVERAALQRRLVAAVDAGVLSEVGADAAAELARARAQSAAEKASAEAHEERRLQASSALSQLADSDRELAIRAGRAEESVKAARADLDAATVRTDALAAAIEQSGLVDIHPLTLVDHEAIAHRLGEALDAARLKQVRSAVAGAAADRAALWLGDHERLPPRADVERLCERALAHRLGARPGWTYLSTLPPDVADKYVADHPALADGIVVNVPEDMDAVVAMAAAARDELDAPIVIGPAGAFEAKPDEIDARAKVILPHSAHWSTAAGRELVGARTAEAARWRAEYEEATVRGENALKLRQQLNAWVTDVGPSGLETRRTQLRSRGEEHAAIAAERASLAGVIAARIRDRDEAEGARDAARKGERAAILRAQQLESLVQVRERMAAIDARLDVIEAEETDATVALKAAEAAMLAAQDRQKEANHQLARLAAEVGELTSERSSVTTLSALAVRPDDPVTPDDEAADRQLLAQQVRDRDSRWQGAVTDPLLRAQLTGLQSAIAEIERQLGRHAAIRERAQKVVDGQPSRSADDHRGDADQARGRVEALVQRIGELRATAQQLEDEVAKIQAEYKALRRPAELAAADTSDSADHAITIRERLRNERDMALELRGVREAEQESAVEAGKKMQVRLDLIEAASQRMSAGAQRLLPGGALVPLIDVADREARIDGTALLADPAMPEPLTTLLRTAGRAVEHPEFVASLDADKSTATTAISRMDVEIDRLQRALTGLDRRAEAGLENADALLRGTPDDVVQGDRVVQTLRSAPRRALAELAVAHHEDIVQRLTAVRHHVATFDARVEALAQTVYATIAELLREVRRTVRESQLPNTPAMGRWAGAELLQLGGLDTLRVEQRQAAIGATLRGWFNPEQRDDRPRFDSADVVNDLLRAVTPQFTASILIPSDPLDPDHKPVDHLALETSGGEGVTVALILAALLASRRAAARGHRRTTLLLDNPFAKVTKPEFLRLARDVANELDVQLVAFTGMRDLGALTVFPRLTQLRVSRRENANFVVPYGIDDEALQPLLRNGTLFVSPTEWATARRGDDQRPWPVMSAVTVGTREGGDAA